MCACVILIEIWNVSQTHRGYTNPNAFVLMARMILLRSTTLDEYSGIYSRDIQVLAVGRWSSSAGRIVMLGIGWNPSSLAGRAGLDVQKYTCNRSNGRSSINSYLNIALNPWIRSISIDIIRGALCFILYGLTLKKLLNQIYSTQK